jgi:hypothetical protein
MGSTQGQHTEKPCRISGRASLLLGKNIKRHIYINDQI